MKFDAETGPKGDFLRKAIATKIKNLHETGSVTHYMYD